MYIAPPNRVLETLQTSNKPHPVKVLENLSMSLNNICPWI